MRPEAHFDYIQTKTVQLRQTLEAIDDLQRRPTTGVMEPLVWYDVREEFQSWTFDQDTMALLHAGVAGLYQELKSVNEVQDAREIVAELLPEPKPI
jgi:hypothetical protein